ncbi:hypothetical protein BD770DRAFT_385684, partial [Pilaira anomala]
MDNIRYGKFDHAEYLKLHPDVARANVAPYEHFKRHGIQEMRKIAANNNGVISIGLWSDPGYLIRHPDVGNPARWKKSGWDHYVEYGYAEDRDIAVSI